MSVSVSASISGSIYTITVGNTGTFSNDSSTDISEQVNDLIQAAPADDSTVINLEPGTYGVGTPIILSSETSVVGNNATLEYMPGIDWQTNWGLLGNGYQIAQSVSISVQGVTCIISNAHIFGTWFTNAEDIDVQDNTYVGGCDGNAFVSVINSVASNNVAMGMDNVAYDNWNGPVDDVIEDNIGYVYGSTGPAGTGFSGWNILINGSIANLNYTGNAVAYGISAGNAANDGVIDNVLSTNWLGGASVNTDSLLDHGYTTESNITQQGNLSEGLGFVNTGVDYVAGPISNAVVQDSSFVGLDYTTAQGFGVIDSDGNNVPGYQTSNTNMTGNLILGLDAEDTLPDIINEGVDVSSVNNAAIGESGYSNSAAYTLGDGTSMTSVGNITNSGTYVSGTGVIPNLDISAPPTLDAPVYSATLITGLAVDDITGSGTIAVTITSTFGTLSLPAGTPAVQNATILGESGFILTGSLADINADLGELSFTSNEAGWDDAIEINVTDSAGFSATRYIPVNVGTPESGDDQLTTLTPGEVLPELYYTTVAPESSLSNDTVIASSGDNLINMGSTISIVFVETGVDTVIGGSGAGYIATDSGQADIDLTGGGDVSIAGGSGPMTVNAASGDNVIDSGAANALVQGGSGSNTVAGGLGALNVQGGSGAMYIVTLPQDGGNLNANLGSGNSTVFALSGNDYVATKSGSENFIDLGIGDDCVASAGADFIYTGAGSDTIDASAGGTDSIVGGSGSLYLVAGAADTFVDPAAQSTILAGAGNLTVGRDGSVNLLQIDEIANTSRVITVDYPATKISLIGYGANAIVDESQSDETLNATLSDGTLLKLFDPTSLSAVVLSGTLSLIPWANISTPDVVNLDNMLENVAPAGDLETQVIQTAVSEVPSGQTAILYTDLSFPGGLINNGTLVLDPTHLTLDNPLTGDGVINIESGSGLEVNGSVASTQTIAFTGTTGSLILGDANQFFGTITGFTGYDMIDLSNETFSQDGFATLTAGNVLDVVENGQTIAIQLDPLQSYAGNVFDLSNDGLGGTSIADATDFSVPWGDTNLFVNAAAAETIMGNGENEFSATFGSVANVSFNSEGGSGTVVAGGAGDSVAVSGTSWSIVGDAAGGSTIDSDAANVAIQVYGQGNAANNAVGAETTPSNVVGLAGNASVLSAGTNDLIETFAGNDVLTVTNSANILVNGGADTVYAAAGSTAVNAGFNLYGGTLDFINNSTTSATILGCVPGASGGNVTAFGGVGGGVYIGGNAGNNSLIGGAGIVDLVAAGTDNFLRVSGYGSIYETQNILDAGAGGASMVAASTTGFNEFYGGGGTDSIVSFGSGQQTFYVGAIGTEVITGSTQSGAVNQYIFDQASTGGGTDVITNFRSGIDHMDINLNSTLSGVSISGFQPLGGGHDGTLIFLSDATTIQLYGVSEAALQAVTVRGGLSL